MPAQPWTEPTGAPASVQVGSEPLRMLFGELQRRPSSHLLDLGPVCGANIRRLLRRVTRLTVCDLFHDLTPHPVEMFWHRLDYPRQCFDGVLFWDLLDHLEDGAVRRLVDGCLALMRSGGLAACVTLDRPQQTGGCRFDIDEDMRLLLPAADRRQLRRYPRSNRRILELLEPLSPVKTLIYRHGMREFLLRSPAAA